MEGINFKRIENTGEKKPLLKQLEDYKLQEVSSKTKKMKLPRKARVKKRKLKKQWVGILRIDENGNVTGEREQIQDSSYQLKGGTYHSSNGEELLWWEGKYPFFIQPSWKTNPVSIRNKEEKNETYGQKYVMARMMKDAIKVTKKGGNIIIWILIIGAALFGINWLMNGGLG